MWVILKTDGGYGRGFPGISGKRVRASVNPLGITGVMVSIKELYRVSDKTQEYYPEAYSEGEATKLYFYAKEVTICN